MKRREFIELSSRSIGGLLIYSLAGAPMVVMPRRAQSRSRCGSFPSKKP